MLNLRMMVAAACLCAAIAVLPAMAAKRQVTIFGAASLTDAFSEIAQVLAQERGISLRFSFASSSTLARQIEAGAPAQIYASASGRWMDYVADHGLIEPETRTAMVANKLVLIVPADRAHPAAGPVTPAVVQDILGADGRLALGDTAHVPAGIYAKQALEALGAWSSIEARVVLGDNVRAALALVARGEAAAGIVYASDAMISDKVQVVGAFDLAGNGPIIYPVAVIKGQKSAPVDEVYRFITSRRGLELFERFGFSRL